MKSCLNSASTKYISSKASLIITTVSMSEGDVQVMKESMDITDARKIWKPTKLRLPCLTNDMKHAGNRRPHAMTGHQMNK